MVVEQSNSVGAATVDRLRVLFVDDDPSILGGIRDSLRRRRGAWDMRFLESGVAALEDLQANQFDVIVADMRMPGMTGAELLAEVRRISPATVRIVLSGHTEAASALRALPVAHQFVNKPCSSEILDATISRTWHLQQMICHAGLREALGRIDRLPPVPTLYAELRLALLDPEINSGRVAAILRKDAAMSAKLLQLVNSGFLRTPRKISSVEQAVVYLGFGTLGALVLSMGVFSSPGNGGKSRGLSARALEAVKRHGFQVASLASALFSDRAAADEAFMAGLLHDIGRLVVVSEFPVEAAELERQAAETRERPYILEQRHFGVCHAEVGAYLLGLWGLPWGIVDAVARHHQVPEPGSEPGLGADIGRAVFVANEFLHLQDPSSTVEERELRGAQVRDAAEALGGERALTRLEAEVTRIAGGEG